MPNEKETKEEREAREIKDLKKLMTGQIKEAVEQYQRASLDWLCSNATDEEIDRKKRSLFMDYSDSFKTLHENLFTMKDGQLSPKNDKIKEYLEKNDMLYMMEDYEHMVIDREIGDKEDKQRYHQIMKNFVSSNSDYKEERRSTTQDPLENSDVRLTEEQKKGLRDFHKWLHRNCDKVGATFLNVNGNMRNLADEFMRQPASVQLKTLYLLETGTRKDPNKEDVKDAERTYQPDLKKLKDQMIASKWKFWKRTSGSQFYWHRLKESLDAVKDLDSLESEPVKKEFTEKFTGEEKSAEEKESIEEKKANAEKESGVEEDSFFDKVEKLNSNLSDVIDTNIMGRIKDPHDYTEQIFNTFDMEYPEQIGNAIKGLGAVGAGMRALLGSVAVGFEIKDLIKGRNTMLAIDKTAKSFGVVSDTGFAAAGAADATSNTMEVLSSLDFIKNIGTTIDTISNCSSILTGVAGSAMMVSGGVDVISSARRSGRAENAEKIADEIGDKELKDLARLSHIRNCNKGMLGSIKLMQGTFWAGSGFSGILVGGLAGITSPVFGLAAVGVGVAAQAAEVALEKEMYRDTIDHELRQKGTDIYKLDKTFKNILENRRDFFKKGTKEWEKLNKMLSDKNSQKRQDIIRKEKATEENCMTMAEYHKKIMDAIGNKIYEKCYEKDGKQIYKEDEAKLFDKNSTDKETKTRVGYRELQKSFGMNLNLPTRTSKHPENRKEKLKEGLSM